VASAAPRAAGPRTWLLLAEKRGDNAQVEALAEHLPWSCERRDLRMRPPFDVEKPRVRATLDHLDPERSDALEPPWPDLILTVGRRPSMAALWVKERSGGRTRIVLVGKPSGRFADFDLVIGSAEVQLPPLPNTLGIALPLLRVDPAALAAASDAWRPALEGLPRPLVGLLVGGSTGPYRLDDAAVERLLALARDVVARGGTPYATTSRRTPRAAVERLRRGLPPEARLFAWSEDATDNPYLGLLGLADGFAVTGDSVSMLVEVARLRRPLSIVPLSTAPFGAVDQLRRAAVRRLFDRSGAGPGAALRRRLAVALFRAGLATQTRDFEALHGLLEARGLAVRRRLSLEPPRGEVPDDLGVAAERVRALCSA